MFAIVLSTFCLTVSAKGSLTDGFSDTSVDRVTYNNGTYYSAFNKSYIDVFIASEYISSASTYLVKQVILIPRTSDIISLLNTSDFLDSSLDACVYLELLPSYNTWVNTFYSSTDVETNFDSFFKTINLLGDNIRENSLNYNNGYNSGYDVGYSEGEDVGYEAGYETGHFDGYAEGKDDGYDFGHGQGYIEGEKDGFDSARAIMFSWFQTNGFEYVSRDTDSSEDDFTYEFETNVLAYRADGYNEGENVGLQASDVAKTGILTVISAPFYILGNVFNIEIFGINLLSIITILITLSLVAFFLKKIKG